MRTFLPSLRGEAGFSLVELLSAMAIFVGILAAAGNMLYAGQKSANDDLENSTSQAEAQAQIDRMVRELRQGTDVISPSTSNQMTVLVNGSQVSYKCDSNELGSLSATYRACYRLTAAAGAALPSPSASNIAIRRLINGTATDAVFAYTNPVVDDTNDSGDEDSDVGNTPDALSPTYVTVRIKTPAKGEKTVRGRSRTIQLDSGFALRNVRYTVTGGQG